MTSRIEEELELKKGDFRRITVRHRYTCHRCHKHFPKGVVGYWTRHLDSQQNGRTIVLCKDCYLQAFMSNDENIGDQEACQETKHPQVGQTTL